MKKQHMYIGLGILAGVAIIYYLKKNKSAAALSTPTATPTATSKPTISVSPDAKKDTASNFSGQVFHSDGTLIKRYRVSLLSEQ